MKTLWITLSLIAVLVGGVIAIGAGAHAEGQQQTNLIAAAIGGIFGIPILMVIIAAAFKKHRTVKTLFKIFSLLVILMSVITLSGQ